MIRYVTRNISLAAIIIGEAVKKSAPPDRHGADTDISNRIINPAVFLFFGMTLKTTGGTGGRQFSEQSFLRHFQFFVHPFHFFMTANAQLVIG